MADLDPTVVEQAVAPEAAVATHLPAPGFKQPAVTASASLL